MNPVPQPDDKSSRPTNFFVRFDKKETEQSLACRFDQQVAQYPGKIAVETLHHHLTYYQLNCLANRVAHALLATRAGQHQNLKQEHVVLLVEQGTSLVAAILGVLKAGKVYVPMNPSDPPTRLSQFVIESQATTLLTDARNHALAQTLSLSTCVVINIETLDEDLAETNPSVRISPDALAYIYYTSGSTGKPKGVVDTHRNVLHNIMRYTNNLHINHSDKLTLLQSASFSGSVSSLFCALLNGATAFPYDMKVQGLGSPLAAWLNDKQITIYHSVPAIFRSFLHGDVQFPSVRIVRLEGDTASKLDVELFKKHFSPHCLLVNGLGATETGISRQYFVDHATELKNTIVPVGYPIEDVDVLLVDDQGNDVGNNITGEITVKSKYLAAGYWNNPELTARVFAVDGAGVRTYRTGDMGMMRDDGCLEYLGRKDLQLKVKGHRIEAAEVESALLAIEAVKEALVIMEENRKTESRLVAYIVPRQKPAPSTRLLRKLLEDKLPDYMIPARYVIVDALPLNANLKVDRRALPPPDTIARDEQMPFIAPRTPDEVTLVEIWQDILDIHEIGVRDSFFDLGGDSLATVQLLVQIEKHFHRVFTSGTIIQSPTIEQLAKIIHVAESTPCLVGLQPRGSEPPLFCIPAHDGNILVYSSLARHLGADRPFFGLQPVGMGGDEKPITSIEAMAVRYISEMQSVQPRGPYYIGGFCFGGVIALEMAHQLVDAGEEIALIAMFDMNPRELPTMMTRKALEDYTRYQTRRIEEHREERFKQERFQFVLSGIHRNVGKKVKKIAWRITHWWRPAKGPPRCLWDVGLSNEYAFQRYVPRKFPGRITLFLAEKTTRAYTKDPQRTWGELASIVDTILVPGEAGAMLKEPHVEVLAEKLRNSLANSSADG